MTTNASLDVTPLGVPSRATEPILARRTSLSVDSSELELGLEWLLRLRRGAVAGQALALTFARLVLKLPLPYATLIALVAFTSITNAVLAALPRRRDRNWLCPTILGVDVLVLTLMLAFSGGASNPFTAFFVVHVALAALLLEPRLAWGLVAMTVLAFALLLFSPTTPLFAHAAYPWSAHLFGMWVAYALSAAFVAHFIGAVSRKIRARDRKLAEVAKLALQNEHLAMLSSFAANAAHELGSPLATIGLAAKELKLGLERGKTAADLEPDAVLVCEQVVRCRGILSALASRSGESVGEVPVATTAFDIVSELERVLPSRLPPLRVVFDGDAAGYPIITPVQTVTQVLRNLVKNAVEAQSEAGVTEAVELRVASGERLCFHVLDRARGLPPEIRDRLGEPFVTTKRAKGGLGLGVYLAHTFAERAGGYLLFRPRPGGGTDTELCLARDGFGVKR
jgi:two-component system, sensor histidine kinase RegB